jgi:hypothetical protein
MKFKAIVGTEADFDRVLLTLQEKEDTNPHPVILPKSIPSRFQIVKVSWFVVGVRKEQREIDLIYLLETPLAILPMFAKKAEKEMPKWIAQLFKEMEKKAGYPEGSIQVEPSAPPLNG